MATLLPLTVAIILVMVPLHFIRHREVSLLRFFSYPWSDGPAPFLYCDSSLVQT